MIKIINNDCLKWLKEQPAVKFNDIWNIARPTPKENFTHDATFPVELIYRIINSIDTNWEDKILVDIYGGDRDNSTSK